MIPGGIGPAAKETVSALIASLRESRYSSEIAGSFGTRQAEAVAPAIGGISPPAADAVPLLLEVLQDRSGSDTFLVAAIGALGSFPTHAASTVPVLLDVLDNTDDWIQGMAATTALGRLGLCGPAVSAAIPALQSLADDEDRRDRRPETARESIRLIRGESWPEPTRRMSR